MKFITLLMLCSTPLGALPNKMHPEAIEHITEFEYKKHYYIIFGEYPPIHNPDCRCSLRWRGYVNGNEEEDLIIFRDWVSDHE